MWFLMVSVVATMLGADALMYRGQEEHVVIPCEQAKLKCAYRVGCGMALQNYLVGCSAVLDDPNPTHCPQICQHSLIALTSTDEGKALMNCKCSDNECEEQKRRAEICRPVVEKATNKTVVSCQVAQWICAADALCSTALDYYNRYCKAMFHGKKCTARCNNSISILTRQQKAKKLTTCICDGEEDYDCAGIRRNMDKLCFHKHKHTKVPHVHQNAEEVIPTVILATSKGTMVTTSLFVFVVVAAFLT
ncbi:growth arrest-specific protein 1 isoform X2 [Aethina tumida]|nr:growth arrest-specific protein 1 isoform X2 [Aethina tumida]XP_049817323.1 growth arrest-specific protein 1 isoform X2 [Aethina tumida]